MALKAIDSEDLTVDATSGGVQFTSSKLALNVLRARCVVETAQVRVKTDGSVTLTASTNGQIYNVGDEFTITGNDDLVTFRAMRTGSVSGKLATTYEGGGKA